MGICGTHTRIRTGIAAAAGERSVSPSTSKARMAPVAAMVAPVFFNVQGSRVGCGVGVCGEAEGEACGTGAAGKRETAARARGSSR